MADRPYTDCGGGGLCTSLGGSCDACAEARARQTRAPFDLWHDALAEYPDDEAARSLRYCQLMIEHGYIEQLEQAVPTGPVAASGPLQEDETP